MEIAPQPPVSILKCFTRYDLTFKVRWSSIYNLVGVVLNVQGTSYQSS